MFWFEPTLKFLNNIGREPKVIILLKHSLSLCIRKIKSNIIILLCLKISKDGIIYLIEVKGLEYKEVLLLFKDISFYIISI